jgi:hypothetical protein
VSFSEWTSTDWAALLSPIFVLLSAVMVARAEGRRRFEELERTFVQELRRQERTRREDIYVRWARMLYSIPVVAREAIIQGQQARVLDRARKQINELSAEIAIFGSPEVRKAFQALSLKLGSDSLRQEFEQILKEAKPNTHVDRALGEAFKIAIHEEREQVFEAMRHDLEPGRDRN